MTIKKECIDLAKKKAKQSICRYKVSAVGFNSKGEYIGSSTNIPRFSKHRGSIHAEMKLMSKYKNKLKFILICRVGSKNNLLKIDPCPVCQTKMRELGIKWYTLRDTI